MMQAHHLETMARLEAHYANDPDVLALLITGSVVRGEARADSDVDFILITEASAWRKAEQEGALAIYNPDLATYPGGYVDGKRLTLDFLEEVADHGNEIVRSAFESAQLRFSRIDGLEALLARIVRYPEEGCEARMASFSAQMQAAQWYIGEAERHGDAYLKMRFVSELVLWASRLVLAHNRTLYPYHKWMRRRLAGVSDKPAELVALIDALLAEPSKQGADAVVDCLLGWRDWPDGGRRWPEHFMHDTEWAWRRGTPPLCDL